MTIKVYTDGGCRPTNPGPAGWAWVATDENDYICGKEGYELSATNNRMELRAVIEALRTLHSWNLPIEIVSDSAYAVTGCTVWVERWVKNNWRSTTFKPIKNLDEWRELWSLKHLYSEHEIPLSFTHIKGHDGDRWNEFVDEVCTRMCKEAIKEAAV